MSSKADPPAPPPRATPRGAETRTGGSSLHDFLPEPENEGPQELVAPSDAARKRFFTFNLAHADRRVTPAARASDLLTTLEVRISNAMDALEEQIARTERHSRLAEEAIAMLQHRAAVTIADLQQRLSTFDAERQAIDDARKHAMDVVGMLSGIEARILHLTARGEDLERADRQIAALEQRTADTTEAIERRVETFASERASIERSVDTLHQRAAAVAVDLERRLGELASQQRAIDAASAQAGGRADRLGALLSDERVADLERRAAAASAEVERAIQARGELEQDVARRTTPSVPLAGQSASRAKAWLASITRGRTASRGEAIVVIAVVVTAAVLVAGLMNRPAPASESRSVPSIVVPPVLASRSLTGGATTPSVVSTVGDAPAVPVADGGPAQMPPPRVATARATPAPDRTARPASPVLAAQATRARDELDEEPPGSSRFVGDLSISSDPVGATVFVDQRAVGQTPVVLNGLRVGSHVVRIERDGYARWSTAVLVSTVKQTRVSAKLEPTR